MSPQLDFYLHRYVPISAAMGITALEASDKKVVLQAPIANNINDKLTAFGGSLHALATLACWSLIYMNLNIECLDRVQVFISESKADYLSPVTKDFSAECHFPEESEWNTFMKMFKRKGKARITLRSKIFDGDKLCVDFHGTFAAILPKDNAQVESKI